GVFPINKNLWTSSFVLLSGGLAAVTLAATHWILDVKRWRGWELPFLAFGRNPLAGYFLSSGVDSLLVRWTVVTSDGTQTTLKGVLYQSAFARWAVGCCSASASSLFYALGYVAMWAIVLIVMYRQRVFVGI